MRVTTGRGGRRRGRLATMVAGLAVGLLVACGGPAGGSGGGTEELTIGLIGPLSGSGSEWGIGMRGAVELAIDEANAAGGIDVGGKRYTIALKAYDDQYQATAGLTALNRLINLDKVNILIGSIGGVVNSALVPVANQNKVLHLTDGLGDYIGPESPYTFRVHPDISVWGPADAKWIAENTPGGVRSVVLLTTDDESGTSNAEPVAEGYRAAGATVTIEKYRRGTTDFNSILTRLLTNAPDVIEAEGTPADAPLIVKQARELGYKGHITHVGGPVAASVLSVAGPQYAEGFTYFAPFDTRTPAYQEFAKRFTDKYRANMNEFAPYFYDSTQMLFKALSSAGTVADTAKIADTLRQTTFDSTLRGPISYGGESTWGCKCEIESASHIGRITGGQMTVVAEVSGTVD